VQVLLKNIYRNVNSNTRLNSNVSYLEILKKIKKSSMQNLNLNKINLVKNIYYNKNIIIILI